jgi:hypothetical protein
MSQIYKNMNKVGKRIFWVGIVFVLLGLLVVLTKDEARMIGIGAMLSVFGFYYLAIAQFDERCNIKNDSKGNLLSTV